MKKEVITILAVLTLIPFAHALCGDGTIQQGETCETCAQDVICASDENCIHGICQKEIAQNNNKIIYGTIAIIFILTLLIVTAYALYKRKQYGFKELK